MKSFILRSATDIAKFVIVVCGLGLLFAWLGVYGTGNLPFYKSLIFWTTTMAVGSGSAILVTPWLWGARFAGWPDYLKIIAAAALVSLPITPTLFLFNGGIPANPVVILWNYGLVMVISLIVSVLMYFGTRYRELTESTTDSDNNPVKAFLERLPIKYRAAELHAIASEDHYLRVYTNLGGELILMRLADAVRELDGADGLQVHRSWWVARSGVVREERQDGRSLLVLPTGIHVPVSRSFRERAKDAGLTS